MTLIQVIDAARALLGGETLDSSRTAADNTSSFWGDTPLTTYHNLVQQEVQNEIIQAFEDYFVTSTFFSIVNGTAEYTLPTDFIKVRRVEDVRNAANPTEIYPVSLNEKGSRAPATFSLNSAANWANGYYIIGNQIVFTDTPTFTNSASLKMYYVQRLSDVTALSNSSQLPPEHHRVLVWGIVKHALFQQQSDTTIAEAEFNKHLGRLRSQVEDRQVQRPRMVVRTYNPNQGGFL